MGIYTKEIQELHYKIRRLKTNKVKAIKEMSEEIRRLEKEKELLTWKQISGKG